MKLFLNLAIMFAATAVSAATGGHGESHGIPWNEMIIPQTVNFVLFTSVLAYFLVRPIKNSFAERGQKFETAVKRAEEVRLTAERANKEVKDRLAKLEGSTKVSVEEAQKEASLLRERIIAEAKDSAMKVAQEAQRNTEFELQKAMLNLRAELVSNSVKIAEDEVRTKTDATLQKDLQKEFLKKVEGVRI
jgi:F-type H+-transporting ATPase subunit b